MSREPLAAPMGKSTPTEPGAKCSPDNGNCLELLNLKVLVLNEVLEHPDEDFSNKAAAHRQS